MSNGSNQSDEEDVLCNKFLKKSCNNERSFPQMNQDAEHDFDFVEGSYENDTEDVNHGCDIDEQPTGNFVHSPIHGMNYIIATPV